MGLSLGTLVGNSSRHNQTVLKLLAGLGNRSGDLGRAALKLRVHPESEANRSYEAIARADTPAVTQSTPLDGSDEEPVAIPLEVGPRDPGFADLIRSLSALRDEGLLTEAEFQEKKQEILKRV